jgi:hypothetical protein
MQKLIDALEKASAEATHFMTGELRRNAVHHGWDPEVASSIYVDHDFKVRVPAYHAEAAWKHEYGSITQQPTAVIRKYNNSHAAVDRVILHRAAKHIGGSL